MSGGHDKVWLEGQIKGEYHFLKESDAPLSETINPVYNSEGKLTFTENSFSHQEDDLGIITDETLDSNFVDYSFGEEQDIAAFDLSADDEQEDALGRWGESDTLFSDDLSSRANGEPFSRARSKNLDTGQLYREPFYRENFPRNRKNADLSVKNRYHSDKDSELIYEIEYQGPASTEESSNHFSSLSLHHRSEPYDPNRYPLPDDYVRNIINRKKYKERENPHALKDEFHDPGKSGIASGRQSLVGRPHKPGHQHRPKKAPKVRTKNARGPSINRNQPVTIVINRGSHSSGHKGSPISLSLTGGGHKPHVVPLPGRPGPPRHNHNFYRIFKLPVIDRTAIILFLVFIAAVSVGPLAQILFASSQGKKRNKDAKASLMHREDDAGSPILELHRHVQTALDVGDDLYGDEVQREEPDEDGV